MDDYVQSDLDFQEEELDEIHLGPVSVEQELQRFRKQWQEELSKNNSGSAANENETVTGEDSVNGNVPAEGPSIEEQARFLFLQGVSAEQSGKVYDAIQFYRRAVQLVPDIEFKIDDYKPRKPKKVRTISECSVDSTGSNLGDNEDPDELEDLLGYFQKLQITEAGLCSPKFDTMSTHISDLPVELMNYIFKWCVSSELDVVSLEYLSLVSRGFYVCARDEELWRLICQRVWGRKCGDATNYGCYRNMYYQRPHIRFNGLYISKCSYYRQGERSLDYFYKPYQLVEYYRYVRFYPEGQMAVLNTPEDPSEVIPKLKSLQSCCRIQCIQVGYYRLTGDIVTSILKRKNADFRSPYDRFKRKNRNDNVEEQTFHIEYTLCHSGKRQYSQLLWNDYSYHQYNKATGEETVTDFELNNQNYPALIFSRVKNYTAQAEKPLQ